MSAIPGDLGCFFFFAFVIASAVIVLAWLTVTLTEERKKKESQKIDNLPVLATRWSGTSAMLSSKVNCPVAHESTR